MNTKHTPGPWFVRGPYIVAGIWDVSLTTKVEPQNRDLASEWKGNAYLISAAPDLFKACLLMDAAKTERQVDKALDAARAAIAKAKGEAP